MQGHATGDGAEPNVCGSLRQTLETLRNKLGLNRAEEEEAKRRALPTAQLVLLTIGDFLARFRPGWNTPIRPDHVKVPAVPVAWEVRGLRALIALAIVFLVGSIPPSITAARELKASGTLHAAPFLGVYTAIDIAAALSRTFNPFATVSMSFAPQQAAEEPKPQTHPPAWALRYLLELVPAAIIALIAAIAAARMRGKIPKKYEGTKVDAEWMTLNDYRDAGLLDHDEPGIVVGAIRPPPLFGIIKRKLMLLIDKNPAHVLAEAASRSGKDAGPVTFTAALNPYSSFHLDTKNESYLMLSGLLRDYYGKDVYRLCFQAGEIGDERRRSDGKVIVERYGSSKWNAFDEISWGTDQEYPGIFQLLTTMIVKDMKLLEGENAHWYLTSRVAGVALGYKTMYDPDEILKCPSRIAMLLAGDEAQSEQSQDMKGKLATDGAEVKSIHDVIEHYLGFTASGMGSTPAWLKRAVQHEKDRLAVHLANKQLEIGRTMSEADFTRYTAEARQESVKTIARIEKAMVHPDMERAIRNTMRIQGEEASSVYSTINAALTPWLDPNVIRNTRESTMTILGMNNGERPAATFLVNPIEYGDMYYPIYRVWMDLALRLQIPIMDEDPEKKRVIRPHKWPMIWIINEPMTLRDIPQLVPSLPMAASFGHRFIFAYQLKSQLIEQYGDNEPISGNCFTTIIHTPNDPEEQKDISAMLGERMILTEHESRTGMQTPNKSIQPDTVPLLSQSDVAKVPNDPQFRMWRNPTTGKREPKPNSDGSLHIRKPAFQILKTRTGYGYTRKLFWFTDDFPHIFRLISRYPAVPPTHSNVVSRTAVTSHALLEARTAPDRPSPTPTKPSAPKPPATIDVALQDLKPVPQRATDAPTDPKLPRTKTQHRFRVVQRLEPHDTRPPNNPTNDLPPSFQQFE